MLTFPSSSAVVPRNTATSMGNGLNRKILLPVDDHQLDEIFFGTPALARAAMPGIDESMQAGPRDEPGPAGSHVAHHLRQDALRQRVGLDLVGEGKLDHHGRIDQCARDRPLEHSVVTETRGPFGRTVAKSNDMDQRQPLG